MIVVWRGHHMKQGLFTTLALVGSSFCVVSLHGQEQWMPSPAFSLGASALSITRPAQGQLPFSVAGERGALFGQQDGRWEAWAFPVKLVSHFTIQAELAGYPIPIDVNELASTIEVNPERTTITYSHAAFTIRQHMFAPRGGAAGSPAAVVFFEIHAGRAMALTFRFTPEMLRMWPAANFGRPSGAWVTAGTSGYYILHTDNEKFVGAVGMPGATPGVLPPYQERPRTWPLEFKVSYEPARDGNRFFPVLMGAGSDAADLGRQLRAWSGAWASVYSQTAAYYQHFFDSRLTVHTPNPQFDLAMRWAELATDQCQVRFHDETGLVAGYYSSADSARPGFGWFFGRDSLFTIYALNAYGDWELSRKALDFLLTRQRDDGKIMHEFSQSADLVDWKATPYFYAAADATPLLIMTMADYWRASGDLEYVRSKWSAVQQAWKFTRAHDSDGDGIYENTEGTGWVESWPPGMPHQEIYLAALDRQASSAMAVLASAMGDTGLAAAATKQADLIAAHIEAEYYNAERDGYAFSRNADGSLDAASTVFPAVAWWDGTYSLAHAAGSLRRWASAEFSTDWGLRDLSPATSFYDPISYHQGSVWPLYTGWEALAQYRGGNAAAGLAALMQNAGQTFTQDLGYVTELLSGEFFQPFGRSSPHQLWSSAMVITPAVRGLFGVTEDAVHNTLQFSPRLPASWNEAELINFRFGKSRMDVRFARSGAGLRVTVRMHEGEAPCLKSPAEARPLRCGKNGLDVALPVVEVEQPTGLPLPGAVTAGVKILSQVEGARQMTLEMEGMGGTNVDLRYRFHRPNVRVEGAAIANGRVLVTFPSGTGYQRKTVTFRW
jgi:hypothetical protein